jgi:hypothetical protein
MQVDQKMHLFWQSDRPSPPNQVRRWRIWQAAWETPSELTSMGPVADHWLPDKEPALVLDDGKLRLFRRWQQHGTRTVNTRDTEAMQRFGAFEDATAYTYDCGRQDGRGGYLLDNSVRYNRQTIGVLMLPDLDVEPFTFPRDWEWISGAWAQFLPIHVRAVHVLQPGLAEDEYETNKIQEEITDVGVMKHEAESCNAPRDSGQDWIVGWEWFYSWSSDKPTCHTVEIGVQVNYTKFRTWHTALGDWPKSIEGG